MSSGLAAHLYVDTGSVLHDLPAAAKITAAVLSILVVVTTPREAMWAFALHATVILGVAALGRVPLVMLVKRLTIELPFVAFAFLLPFVAGGERVDVGPLSLSVDGLWGAWNILAKGTLGVATTVVLTATTSITDLLRGLERLHMPRIFVAIMVLMIRFGVVITDESRRMQIARLSRGYDPRWFWQAKAVASSAGNLFVRSYERGERVYLAMVARGYSGTFPSVGGEAARPGQWAATLVLPALSAVIAAVAWST